MFNAVFPFPVIVDFYNICVFRDATIKVDTIAQFLEFINRNLGKKYEKDREKMGLKRPREKKSDLKWQRIEKKGKWKANTM